MNIAGTTEPKADPRPIRAALLLDTPTVPAWVARAVEDVASLQSVRLRCVLLSPSDAAPAGRRLLGREYSGLLRLYQLLDRLLFQIAIQVPDAQRPTDIYKVLSADIPMIRLEAEAGPLFSDGLRQAVEKERVDLVLNFGRPIAERLLEQAPRMGVWELKFGGRGEPVGLWEIMENNATIEVSLSARGPGSEVRYPLAQTVAAVDMNSFFRTRNRVLWQSAPLFRRGLQLVTTRGFPPPSPNPEESKTPLSPRVREGINHKDAGRFVGQVSRHVLGSLYRETFFHKNWFILLRKTDTLLPGENWTLDPKKWRRLLPSADRFYADPFLFSFEGRPYLFFEDFRWRTGRGHIAVTQIGPDGRPGPVGPALTRPYHLSYPFIFSWQGDVYLLPESRQNRTVALFRAVRFPDQWEQVRVLFEDLPALDPTLCEYGGRWWLFMNIAQTGGDGHEELHLFFAPAPLGPWQAHPLNPIVSDVRRARPAGRIFMEGGRLFRPGQDCSVRYGGALRIHEITVLTEIEYREREVGRLSPERLGSSLALHTYNAQPPFEVLDGCAYTPRFWPRRRRP